jgi:hypothetical protein
MKGHEGIWVATAIEIAEWQLEQSFLETPEPLSAAVASNFQSRSIPHYFLSKKDLTLCSSKPRGLPR